MLSCPSGPWRAMHLQCAPKCAVRCGFWVLLLVSLMPPSQATKCYVGVLKNRIVGSSVELIDCPAEVYGEKPACGWACAKDELSKEDICSFVCLPAHQCGEGGYIHPDSPLSPGNFMAGCPPQDNYEPLEKGALDCSARCCSTDGCNSNGSITAVGAPGFLLSIVSSLSALALALRR